MNILILFLLDFFRKKNYIFVNVERSFIVNINSEKLIKNQKNFHISYGTGSATAILPKKLLYFIR